MRVSETAMWGTSTHREREVWYRHYVLKRKVIGRVQISALKQRNKTLVQVQTRLHVVRYKHVCVVLSVCIYVCMSHSSSKSNEQDYCPHSRSPAPVYVRMYVCVRDMCRPGWENSFLITLQGQLHACMHAYTSIWHVCCWFGIFVRMYLLCARHLCIFFLTPM